MRITLKQQLNNLRKEAKKRGLRIVEDNRLTKTPYRAMNPFAAKELRQKCYKNTIAYSNLSEKTLRQKVMDIRHEIIEFDEMKKGKKYKQAHKIANRKQRAIDSLK